MGSGGKNFVGKFNHQPSRRGVACSAARFGSARLGSARLDGGKNVAILPEDLSRSPNRAQRTKVKSAVSLSGERRRRRTGITACRMDRSREAGVADEIVDGGLRIPKGWSGERTGWREHDGQDEEESRGCGSGSDPRKVRAASGDYGWP